VTLRRLRPLAPDVLVATSRRDATNSVLVLGPGGPAGSSGPAVLVDPAWTPDELEGLGADLRAIAPRSITGFSTHAHVDHLLWHPGFGPGPRCAGATTAALASSERAALLAELGSGYPRSALAGAPALRPVEHALPGPCPAAVPLVSGAHERGHTALWFPRQRLLVAGDLLSDVEVPLLEASDRFGAAHRAGLTALAPYVRRARFVVPGHGAPTTDGAARLAADLAYLDALVGTRDAPPDDPRLRAPAMAAVWRQQRAAFSR
jgi:glyoxylase-like metal-dependent hydrolase (beta-lactamase superfamily II)